jgi:hypothetical protein
VAIVPSDEHAPVSNVFTKAANGQTAGSYTGDGRWNIGGWSTYPLTGARAADKTARPAAANEQRARR